MRLSFVVMLLAAAAPRLVGVPSVSSACTCVPPSDFYSDYMESDAIFLGEVVAISNAEPEQPYQAWVTILVEDHWNGEPPDTTRMLSGPATCVYPFVIGRRYLVYARLANGVLSTSLCSRTHTASPNDPDLDLLRLGPPSPPVALGLTVKPNPSRGQAQLAWTIPTEAGGLLGARIEVMDFQGRRVATLVSGPVGPGPHETVWDGRDAGGRLVPAGFYWVRLAYAGKVTTRKLVRITGRP